MIRVEKYKTSDYQETSWSGGRTTQLYLFPAQSSYGERNFQFRLSTASMDTEQSTFTSLPSYHRILLSLDQTIVLQDMSSEEQVTLAPYHIHRFEGEQSIQCVGKAQDFNIIFDDSIQADLQVMDENKWVVECEGDFIGFNVGILGWMVTMFAWAAMAAGFAKMFIITFPAFEGMNIPLSIGLVILLSLMNIAGLRTSKVFTITATIAKLIPILLFSLCAIFFIPKGLSNFSPFVQLSEGQTLLGAISGTAIYIFYGFIGFETLSIVAGEMRNPEKNVPRAILGSISIVSILYMLIIGGTIAMLGSGIMDTKAPVQDALVKMIGPAGYWLVSIGALISITGLNMGESIMVPRFGAAIAEEGLLPAAIARKNSKDAPVVAIIISCVIAIILLLSGSFEILATLSVVFRFFQYIPTALAVNKLRKDEPDAQVVFRLPFGPVIPTIAVVISLIMIWGDNPMNFVYGAIGLLISSAIYFFMHGRKKV